LRWQPNFGQNMGENLTKLAITSVICHILMQFCFEVEFQLSANSPMTLPYTRDKRRYYGNKFWDKNCYKCISARVNEIVITYNGVSWSTNPMKTFLTARI